MNELWQCFALVALSEMGDKTQLLAIVLVLRFNKPWTILLGILLATLANHGLAAAFGGWLAEQFDAKTLKSILVVIFIIFGLWILIPDKEGNSEAPAKVKGAFLTTFITFFLAEMGDKTQLATAALGARHQSLAIVIAGTTLGMMVSDGIAVFLGAKLQRNRSSPWIKRIRWVASLSFFAFAIWIYGNE